MKKTKNLYRCGAMVVQRWWKKDVPCPDGFSDHTTDEGKKVWRCDGKTNEYKKLFDGRMYRFKCTCCQKVDISDGLKTSRNWIDVYKNFVEKREKMYIRKMKIKKIEQNEKMH